jgi:hypothetical protein
MANIIAGVALTPRQSLNGIYYDVDELRKFDGVTAPLYVEHQGPESEIGEVTFSFDTATNQVRYRAIVEDQEWQTKLDEEEFQVSIGASVSEPRELCDDMKKKCLNAPVLGAINELSIVKRPGIPESTLTVIEKEVEDINILSDKNMDVTEIITSVKENKEDNTQMADNSQKKTVEEKVTIITDSDVEVQKTSPPKEEAPVEAPKEEAPAVEAPKEEAPAKEDVSEKVAERIEKSNAETVKAVISELKESWQPKSEVAEATTKKVEEAFTDDEAAKLMEHAFKYGSLTIKVDKEGWIEANTFAEAPNSNGSVHEAISTSGTIPGVKQASNVSIQVGAKTSKPIRQYGQFAAIPTGQNTARFYRITVPDAGAITESPTTDITAATHTLTSIDVTCSIRGWRQTIEKAELEDYPASFLNAIRETARLEAIRDEHRLILQDLGSTSRDFGGTSTAPYHLAADDGSAVTTTTLEDAAGEMGPDGLTFAKRYLDELGQDTKPGDLIAFMSPRAFESLYTATGLSEYTQIGNATLTRQGNLERIYGVDIIVTNELEVGQNNADRNLVCVKGKSWALASQRTMEIELQKQIAGQYWDVVWTHRIGVNVLDPNTYVILSSPNA